MKWLNNTRVGGLVFLALSLAYGYHATQIQLDFFSQQEAFNARSMPQLIAGAGVVCSLLMIALPSKPTEWQALKELNWRRPLLLLALMWGYASAFEYVGFAAATTLFLLLAFFALGERRPVRMIAVAVPLVGGFWLLMHLLGIYLSPGDLFADWLAAGGRQ